MTNEKWNSATTLYIARKLETLAKGRQLAILDMGCGDGSTLSHLLDAGYDLYGYDIRQKAEARLRASLGSYFGDSFPDHLKIAPDERTIPFPDNSFDVVYANQVFEHVKFLDRMIAECARVLKPDGTLISLFPLASSPIEWHGKIPFAHWIPPGQLRIRYLQAFYTIRRPPRKNHTPYEMAVRKNRYLETSTFYHLKNEVTQLAEHYFIHWELDGEKYLRARLDLWDSSRRRSRRWLAKWLRPFEGKRLAYLVDHYFGATFLMHHPRK